MGVACIRSINQLPSIRRIATATAFLDFVHVSRNPNLSLLIEVHIWNR